MPTCPSCNSDCAAGARWCSICHTNLVNSAIGRLASPGKRLGAYCLDVFIPLMVVWWALIGAALFDEIMPLIVVLAVLYAVWSLILFAKGATVGKKLLGMRVVKEDGEPAGFFTMLIREWIGKSISGFVLFLGYLWILFDQENQGWHDKLMSTYVVSDFQR